MPTEHYVKSRSHCAELHFVGLARHLLESAQTLIAPNWCICTRAITMNLLRKIKVRLLRSQFYQP